MSTHQNTRTRIGDIAYLFNSTGCIAEIPTKNYADTIAANLTDVSPSANAYRISYSLRIGHILQSITIPSLIFRQTTARYAISFIARVMTHLMSAEPYINSRQGWHGCFPDHHDQPGIWLPTDGSRDGHYLQRRGSVVHRLPLVHINGYIFC